MLDKKESSEIFNNTIECLQLGLYDLDDVLYVGNGVDIVLEENTSEPVLIHEETHFHPAEYTDVDYFYTISEVNYDFTKDQIKVIEKEINSHIL